MKALALIPYALVTLTIANPLWAQAFDAGQLADDETLENTRGKFLLPNGVEVAMTVQTDTSVDGQLLLRSVFSLDKGPPNLTIYSPTGTNESASPPAAGAGQSAAPQADIWVSFDRNSGVSLVERDYRSSPTNLSVSSDTQTPIGDAPEGAAPLPLQTGGDSVQTANGAVALDKLSGGYKVSLTRPDLEINHVFGQAVGSVLLNSGNDRTIDTATTINLDLANATPAMVGSAMPRIEGMALDAARDLIR